MKKLSIYFYLLIGLLLSWSCEEESNMDEVGNWDLSSPVLTSPASGAAVTLDANLPATQIPFQWDPAVASNRFGVAYRFLLVEESASDLSNPILEIVPANSGKDRIVQPTAEQIDYALAARCYPAGATVQLKWAVVAKAIETESQASNPISFTRFATERQPTTLFITGAGAEAGVDVANATPMRAQLNADGAQTGIFDVYTTLAEGQSFNFRDQANASSLTFGGKDGNISMCGDALVAPATGQYRVTVDMVNKTYNLLKIEKWSLVGDAVPGGWGGDAALEYKGNGVWEGQVDFVLPNAGFIFRANLDWAYIIKQVKGTVSADGMSGKVIMESEAAAAGVEVEDSKFDGYGMHTVTLDLSANGYTFSIVAVPVDPGENQAIIGKTSAADADKVAGNFLLGEYDTPEQLYLLNNNQVVVLLTKDGDKFTTAPNYVALEASKTYTLNSASDGTGTTYNEGGDGSISVDHDQAYQISVDFSTGKLSWAHYNLKLFHWDEVGGGWDQRQELLMTYIHPFTFEVTGTLSAGYHSKFISPWEVQFGTSATALSGTMTNGGDNYTGIAQNGSYKATIVVSQDFTTADYSFVKQ